MRKGSRISVEDDTVRQELMKARYRVMSDPDVRQYLHKKPGAGLILRVVFWRVGPTAVANVKELKEKSMKGYKRLVDSRLQSLGDTAEQYARSHSTIMFDGKPLLLCKYMPKGHAVDNILHSETKYGSIGEYRRDDGMECVLPIAPEMKTSEFIDVVRARIVKSMLEEQGIDILSIWDRVQDSMEDNFFIGSFSDGSNPEYMWHKYANDDGVCVWFEPDYSKLKVIVYSDYLAEADKLREDYSEMMLRLAKEGFGTIKGDIESLTKEIIDLSYMSFYTKKPDFDKETEWRELVPCADPSRIRMDDEGHNYILEAIPGRIVRVESRLPKSEYERLMREKDPEIEVIDETGNRVP